MPLLSAGEFKASISNLKFICGLEIFPGTSKAAVINETYLI